MTKNKIRSQTKESTKERKENEGKRMKKDENYKERGKRKDRMKRKKIDAKPIKIEENWKKRMKEEENPR